ncbi:hypothetical protein CMI37_23635 [Candidatus Pacearchaeota archaeon]|nr:hypothetical protein [Candidatus Pacearchaeota archaeon]|tara:strand:- start:437 stop:742 length:306 start_codon:yes stop_codon:yes gene_type:complete
MIKFVEVVNETTFNSRLERVAVPQFSLKEVWINEKYVVNLRAAPGYDKLLREGRLGELHSGHDFTLVTVQQGGLQESYVVVGAVAEVAGKLNQDRRTLLRG